MIILLFSVFKNLIPPHIAAITFWPFIFFRENKDKHDLRIINHERIHLKQQVELLVIPFYVIYLIEYLVFLVILRNHDKAYRNIGFEREAYENDGNIVYLNSRKWYAMWRN